MGIHETLVGKASQNAEDDPAMVQASHQRDNKTAFTCFMLQKLDLSCP